MAEKNRQAFHTRLSRIERDHRHLAGAYVRLEERDGMLVPVREVRSRQGFPWRGLFLVLIVFVLFKATLLAHLGPVRYVEQHAKLEQGSVVEQFGAWALRPDAATVYLSDRIRPIWREALRLTSFGG